MIQGAILIMKMMGSMMIVNQAILILVIAVILQTQVIVMKAIIIQI